MTLRLLVSQIIQVIIKEDARQGCEESERKRRGQKGKKKKKRKQGEGHVGCLMHHLHKEDVHI